SKWRAMLTACRSGFLDASEKSLATRTPLSLTSAGVGTGGPAGARAGGRVTISILFWSYAAFDAAGERLNTTKFRGRSNRYGLTKAGTSMPLGFAVHPWNAASNALSTRQIIRLTHWRRASAQSPSSHYCDGVCLPICTRSCPDAV